MNNFYFELIKAIDNDYDYDEAFFFFDFSFLISKKFILFYIT